MLRLIDLQCQRVNRILLLWNFGRSIEVILEYDSPPEAEDETNVKAEASKDSPMLMPLS
jgi:hypothetical protein